MSGKRKGGRPYEYEPKTYRLHFADEGMEGLEVEASSPSIGGLLRVVEASSQVEEQLAGDAPDMAAVLRAARDLFTAFGGYLVSWNLHVGGQPVPCGAEGLLERDLDFAMAVVKGWIEAVSSVDSPLPGGSSSTPPSELGLAATTVPSSPPPPG